MISDKQYVCSEQYMMLFLFRNLGNSSTPKYFDKMVGCSGLTTFICKKQLSLPICADFLNKNVNN